MPVKGHWVSWQCVLSWSSTGKKFKDNYYWLTDGDTCSHIWLRNYKGSECKSDLIFTLPTHGFPIGDIWSQTCKTHINRDIWTFNINQLIFLLKISQIKTPNFSVNMGFRGLGLWSSFGKPWVGNLKIRSDLTSDPS